MLRSNISAPISRISVSGRTAIPALLTIDHSGVRCNGGQIHLAEMAAPTPRRDSGKQVGGLFILDNINASNVEAGLGQRQRNCQADALPGTCYQRHRSIHCTVSRLKFVVCDLRWWMSQHRPMVKKLSPHSGRFVEIFAERIVDFYRHICRFWG